MKRLESADSDQHDTDQQRQQYEEQQDATGTVGRRQAVKQVGQALLATGIAACGPSTPSADTSSDAATDAGSDASTACQRNAPLLTTVFAHGVASGDPMPDRVLLWTRVSLQLSAVSVRYEVALDSGFATLVTSGSVETSDARDYTVKVDVTGLMSDRTYYYRFVLGSNTSPIGRTRTAPATIDNPARLRFGVVSCAAFSNGYFHVYRELAERADLHAVVHLGDYIYEHANPGCGGTFFSAEPDVRPYDPPTELFSVADYRLRYAQARTDRDLQEVHRQHPMLVMWDDHEFVNNASTDGAPSHNADLTPGIEPWAVRKNHAKQAYFEWLPVREHDGEIYRALQYGALAELIFIDTRVEGRDKQAEGPDPQPRQCNCPSLTGDERKIISETQEAFALERLAQSTAQYRVICQGVLFSTLRPVVNAYDAWDGYPAARGRLLQGFSQPNHHTLVLTGDMHSAWAFDVTANPYDAQLYDAATGLGSIGVEFVVPAVTTRGIDDQFFESTAGARLRSMCPHLKYLEAEHRGYGILDLAAASAQFSFHFVSDVRSPNRPQSIAGPVFETRTGRTAVQMAATPRGPLASPPAPAP